MLADICLLEMKQEYHVFQENSPFSSSFSGLMEAARRTKESVRQTSTSLSSMISMSQKRYLVADLKWEERFKPLRPNKLTKGKRRPRRLPMMSPFPCCLKKALVLLEEWVPNYSIFLPRMRYLPPHEDQRNLMYCPYLQKRGHNLEQCIPFRRIFNNKQDKKVMSRGYIVSPWENLSSKPPRNLSKILTHRDYCPTHSRFITNSKENLSFGVFMTKRKRRRW